MRKKVLRLNHVHNVTRSHLRYDYSYDVGLGKYFTRDIFFVDYEGYDVSKVPEAIKVIPFLANFAPIAWFAGFDIHVHEMDQTFYNALLSIKREFTKYYPVLLNMPSELIYDKLVVTEIEGSKSAMLFSGGVDAVTTYLRHRDEEVDLITIHGADIAVADNRQFNKVRSFNENAPLLSHAKKVYIRSNIRDFYSFNVDKLLPDLGWWGRVQHGLSISAITAPISFINGYKYIYIASSYTRRAGHVFIPWGSMPEIDNQIRWARTSVIHDGEELTRQEKIDYIVGKARTLNHKINLRVCYSEINDGMNCCICEKCLRTIFAIMLAGDSPNDYGFDVNVSVYSLIEKVASNGFATSGTKQFWRELLEKALSSTDAFYFFEDHDTEYIRYQDIINELSVQMTKKLKKMSVFQKMKSCIINRNKRLFSKYLTFRRR
jgi:hypothetical protein